MAVKKGILIIIDDGILQGSYGLDRDGRTYYSFRGIPYAESPVGSLRFKAPKPIKPWYGVRNAKTDGPTCPQRPATAHMSEDCLHLNVFTPQLPERNCASYIQKPVIVIIHGGRYENGGPQRYGPEYLLTKDVVVVTVSYRLSVLGFLKCEDPTLEIPGNAGMKDQQMALKWVKRNIEKFGGNPNNVTLCGNSSGGHAVDLHGIAPSSAGLFHKVIAMSGTALTQFQINNHSAIEIARIIEPDTQIETEREAMEILQRTDALALWEARSELGGCMGPVLEKPSKKEPAFLTVSALKLLQNGCFNDVPYLLGHSEVEGILTAYPKICAFEEMPTCTSDFEKFIPKSVSFKCSRQELATKVRAFYYGNEKIFEKATEEDLYSKYLLMHGDLQLIIGQFQTIKYRLAHAKSKMFLYRMELVTHINYIRRKWNIQELRGACHGDDLAYILTYENQPKVQPNSLADMGIKRLCTIFANFAKTGDPNRPDDLPTVWPALHPDDMKLLRFGEKLSVDTPHDELRRTKFWNDLGVCFGGNGQH